MTIVLYTGPKYIDVTICIVLGTYKILVVFVKTPN